MRRWNSWYRWVTLAMLGAAVLTIAAAIESARGPAAAGQIPLTRNEIAHLLAAVTAPPGRDAGHRLRWSHRRRLRGQRIRCEASRAGAGIVVEQTPALAVRCGFSWPVVLSRFPRWASGGTTRPRPRRSHGARG